MGASYSTPSNKSIEEIFAAETLFFNKAGSDDISELLDNIESFAKMHKRRMETFRRLKMKFVGQTGGKVIELKENEDIVQYMQNSMATLTPEMKGDIEFLYSMHAIYAERTNNDKMMERKISIFPDFEEGYEYFYNKLLVLGKYKKIEVALDQNLISNQNGATIQSIANARTKAITTINKFLARNIFLTYAVIYNDYLSLIYTMYATKQMRLLNDVYVKSKKQNEFEMITNRLETQINQSAEELKESVNARDDRIKELVKNLDNRQTAAKERVNEFEVIAGGNSETVSLLNQLMTEYENNLVEYTNSNAILNTYFEAVNNIVFESMDKLANFYINLSNKNNVINNNLRLAIKETTEQIRDMSKLTDKEADKRIVEITDRFSADMSEEDKLRYFEAVGGPKGKVLKNLFMLQKDFQNNVLMTNNTLEIENAQHSTMGSPNPRRSDSMSSLESSFDNSMESSPQSSPRRKAINVRDNILYEDDPENDFSRDSSLTPQGSMKGGKKSRKYGR